MLSIARKMVAQATSNWPTMLAKAGASLAMRGPNSPASDSEPFADKKGRRRYVPSSRSVQTPPSASVQSAVLCRPLLGLK